ncbi:MAG: hypothetical protein JNK76_03435 [Planctomycetales bacterium]|nr:hypothetical protein [Planctomycetales bacterium]MBN8625746.1 hypothetical protein [Planctomycetota bacterium]
MKRLVVLALLASVTVLSFADTAEARRCRRRSRGCNTCQTACNTGGCQTGGCHTGYGSQSIDPNMQYQGQPTYADPNMGAPGNVPQAPRPQQAPAAPQPRPMNNANNAAGDQAA